MTGSAMENIGRVVGQGIIGNREKLIADFLSSGAFLNELRLVIPAIGYEVITRPTHDGGLDISVTDLARMA